MASQPSQPVRLRASIHLLVLGFFALLSLALTYPLVLQIRSAIVGPPGDNFEWVWKLWWFKHALLDLHVSPFVFPDAIYPTGLNLGASEFAPVYTILGLPVTVLAGPVQAYNLWFLLSFVLAGYGMFLLVHYHTHSAAAGMLAGVIFAFCPYHLAHAYGHLNIMSIQWLPFVLLQTDLALRTARLRHALYAGLFFAILALTSWYYAYFLGLLLVIYVWMAARGEHRRIFSRRGLAMTGLFVAVVFVLAFPFVRPLLEASGGARHGFSALIIYSASVSDFFLGNPWHPIWGKRIAYLLNPVGSLSIERVVFLGFVPIILALIAILRQRGTLTKRYAVLAIIAVILALGPVLQFQGQQVMVSPQLSPALMNLYQHALVYAGNASHHNVPANILALRQVPIPLPALPLALALPFFDSMRAIARFAIFAMLAIALLAGVGFVRITPRTSRAGRLLLCLVLMGMILFEFAIFPLPLSSTKPAPETRWLARQPGQFTVAWLPPEENLSGTTLYDTMITHKRIIGASLTIMPPEMEQLLATLQSFPAPAALEALRIRGVRYVIVDTAAYGERWPQVQVAIETTGGLRLVNMVGRKLIYELLE
jgi:hypothetical protein